MSKNFARSECFLVKSADLGDVLKQKAFNSLKHSYNVIVLQGQRTILFVPKKTFSLIETLFQMFVIPNTVVKFSTELHNRKSP